MFTEYAWLLPLFSALVWLGTLLGLLIHWLTIGRPHYSSMEANQTIAYISDVGAFKLKPLFITGSAVMVVTFDLAMILERWARHKGKLSPNTSWFQKSMDILSIFAAIVGAAGLVFLTIFNTSEYPTAHDDLLIVFIVGYLVSAIAICTEYQRLGLHYRQHSILRASFWTKLLFIIVEIALAIPFGIFETQDTEENVGAVLEWTIAFIFTLYILSFVIDLAPAFKTRHHTSEEVKAEMAYQPEFDATLTNGHARHSSHAQGAAFSELAQASSNF